VTDLFIGVVSHVGSRFAANCGPDGLAQRLTDELADLGISCALQINLDDDYDPAMLPIDAALVATSLDAQLKVEGDWAAYLAEAGGPGPRPWAGVVTALRRHRARRRYERSDGRAASDAGTRMIRRLLNIELSHRRLLQAGIDTGSPWILILEDDAGCTDVTDCARGLAGIIGIADEGDGSRMHPAYLNLSRSFSATRLGIDTLLRPVSAVPWQGPAQRQVHAATRPVTNTVCAIAYRRDFAKCLLDAFGLMPLAPVIPIDWKLNAALMEMHRSGGLGAGACWLVEPAPIVQLSMHRAQEP